jgi:hypothetical protein
MSVLPRHPAYSPCLPIDYDLDRADIIWTLVQV